MQKKTTKTFTASTFSPWTLRAGITTLVVGLFITALPEYFSYKLRSANLSAVSVTMSNSKLSFFGRLDGNNAQGGSIVSLQTSGNPSNSTANLFSKDVVWIGDGSTGSTYTVYTSTASGTENKFTITSTLDANDFQANDVVIATRSSSLTANFTTVTAIPNGYFRILVPASSNTSASADGMPDPGGFDYLATGVGVTCPANATGYSFSTGVATATAVTVGSTTYHAYSCYYAGNGAIGQSFLATVSAVINPAPTNTHTVGTADTYSIIVQQMEVLGGGTPATDNVIDATTVKVAPIEAVRVTASVAPTLQFSIAGISSASLPCDDGNMSSKVTSSATNVPLGDLAISSFTDAAQTLTVSTNAVGGYVVTARENDQLTRIGTASCADGGTDGYGAGHACIPDTTGASETGVGLTWSSTNTKGFGYTTKFRSTADASTPTRYAYFDGTNSSCTGANKFCARKFPDLQNLEAAEPIFSHTSTADTHKVDVCYRAVVAANQEAGDYENNITYTATATF